MFVITGEWQHFFVITGDEEARAAAGEGSKQGTAETPAANRGEIGPAQPSNTHYLTLKWQAFKVSLLV